MTSNIQRIYQATLPRALTVRGNRSEISLARFLLPELDQPAQTRNAPTLHQSPISGSNDSALVYGLTRAQSGPAMQEIITTLRTILQIQRLFQVTQPHLLAMRASAAELQMAKWLIPQLDRDVRETPSDPMQIPGSQDDFVQVFSVAKAEAMRPVLVALQKEGIKKVYQYTQLPSVTVRGTGDQLRLAAQTVDRLTQ